jgi:hypothetical protein
MIATLPDRVIAVGLGAGPAARAPARASLRDAATGEALAELDWLDLRPQLSQAGFTYQGMGLWTRA